MEEKVNTNVDVGSGTKINILGKELFFVYDVEFDPGTKVQYDSSSNFDGFWVEAKSIKAVRVLPYTIDGKTYFGKVRTSRIGPDNSENEKVIRANIEKCETSDDAGIKEKLEELNNLSHDQIRAKAIRRGMYDDDGELRSDELSKELFFALEDEEALGFDVFDIDEYTTKIGTPSQLLDLIKVVNKARKPWTYVEKMEENKCLTPPTLPALPDVNQSENSSVN